MRREFQQYVLAVFFSAVAVTLGCSGTAVQTSTAPGATPAATLSIEPDALAPEAISGACSARSRFGLRFSVSVFGRRYVLLRALRFEFTDRNGKRALPTVSLLGLDSPTIVPNTSSIPTPGSIVPMPGIAALQPTSLAAGTRQRMSFFLEFGCGLDDSGTLVVIGDFDDDNGGRHSHDVRARVGN